MLLMQSSQARRHHSMASQVTDKLALISSLNHGQTPDVVMQHPV
jgi:hypothetical protein